MKVIIIIFGIISIILTYLTIDGIKIKRYDKAALAGIFAFLMSCAFIGMFYTEFFDKPSSDKVISEDSNNNNSNTTESIKQKIGNKISNKTFYNNENGFLTNIHFKPSEYGAPFGAATLTQSGCRDVYSYNVSETNINLKYTGSECGRSSSDQTLYYDESSDYVYMYINGQKFIFK